MKTRVLVVNSSSVVCSGLEVLFDQEGSIEIKGACSASSSAAVKSAIRKNKPDIVLLGMKLFEDRDPLKAVALIREASASLPIVLISNLWDPEVIRLSYREDVTACICLDSPIEEIATTLKAIAEGQPVEVLAGNKLQRSEIRRLTKRERQVLQMLADGMNTKESASEMKISAKTVETHRTNLMNKLHSHAVSDLTKLAIREGLSSVGSRLREQS